MKQTGVKILLLMAWWTLSHTASADVYFGAKTGPMFVDASGADDPINTAFMIGYEQGFVVGDIGIEGEISRTTEDGEVGGQELDVDTEALYLTLRTAGPIYVKARAGYLQEEVSVGKNSTDDSGTSYGIGVGFGLGLAQIEVEFTQVEEDIDFLSVGIKF